LVQLLSSTLEKTIVFMILRLLRGKVRILTFQSFAGKRKCNTNAELEYSIFKKEYNNYYSLRYTIQ
jgi:hypothetical protein